MRRGSYKKPVARVAVMGAAAALVGVMWACASREPAQMAALPPPPIVEPLVPQAAATPQWNLFPDFTTGKIDVYKDGEYVGSITGDEPEDPPLPHKDPRQLDPAFP